MVLCICGDTTRQTEKHEVTKKHTKAILAFFELRNDTTSVCLPCLQNGKVKFIKNSLVKLREHFKNKHSIRVAKFHASLGVISADFEYLLLREPDLLLAMIDIYNSLWSDYYANVSAQYNQYN